MIKKKGSVCCDSCGVCAHSYCYKKVSRRFKCKEISIDSDGPMKHKWMKGFCLFFHQVNFCMMVFESLFHFYLVVDREQ